MNGVERARLWTVGGAVLALGVLVIGWVLVVSPAIEQARGTQAGIELIETQNETIAARNAVLRAAQDDEAGVRAEHDAARTRIPSQPRIGEFGDALEQLADQSLVTLSRFSASDPREEDDGSGLYSTPLSFTVLGTGERVQDFLDSLLADHQRALLVSGVEMLPVDTEQRDGIAGDIVATVSGAVWTLTDGTPDEADGTPDDADGDPDEAADAADDAPESDGR